MKEIFLNLREKSHLNLANLIIKQLDNGYDFINRIIYLEEHIYSSTPGYIKERVNIINTLSNDSTSPITVELTCFGGDVYGALGAVDTMRTLETPINVVGRGAVMSAATFILAAGTGKRYLTQNTVVMIHEASTWLVGSSKDVITEAEHLKQLQANLFAILAQYSNKDAKFWETNTKTNLYLSVDECLKYGLIDGVVGERNDANTTN